MTLDIFARACWPLRGVDGDTLDFLVDLGEREYALRRYRLLSSTAGVNTPELHASDPAIRDKAVEAQRASILWLQTHVVHNTALLTWPDAQALGVDLAHLGLKAAEWECPVFIGHSAKGDAFGRWLVDVTCQEGHDLGDWLLSCNFAVPWQR